MPTTPCIRPLRNSPSVAASSKVLMKQIRSTFFRRKVKKRVISRSFRITKDIDRLLTEHARKKGWTKTFLIQEIIQSWVTYQKAKPPPLEFVE